MSNLTLNNEKVQDFKNQISGFMTTIGIFFFAGVLITAFTGPAPRPFKAKDSSIGQQIQVQAEPSKEQKEEIKQEETKLAVEPIKEGEPAPVQQTEPTKETPKFEPNVPLDKEDAKVEEMKATPKKATVKSDCASRNKALQKAINQVATEEGVNCLYLLTLARHETGENPNAKNTGCKYIKKYLKTICENSYGAYQINMDAHGKSVTKNQALDPLFATRWVAKRIKGQYGGKPDSNGKVGGWITVLGCHQGKWKVGKEWVCGSPQYKASIEKIGISVGLTY